MENRFLFVIDTSSAMKARTNGVQEAVAGLLASGMKGELRKGDTIGVWTCGESLNTDFPMEVWSEEKKDRIVKEVGERLRGLRYEKRSHLEKALPAIHQVMAASERMTVIFVFDGADSIKGTPFDKDIRDLHKQYARAFRSAREPFVTLLAARNGTVFDYTINYPSAVMVPHTADPLPPPETNAPPPVAAGAPPPPQTPSPPAEAKPPRKIEIILSGSNFTHNASAPPPDAGNVAAVVTPTPMPAPVAATNAPPAAEAAPAAVQAAPVHVAPPPAPVVAAAAKAVLPAPATRSTPAAAPAAPVAAAVSAGQQAAMYIIAFSLLTIAVTLVLLLARRSRGGPQSSLISQAMNRPR